MAINLSGQWTVSVKSKAASFDQRVVVSGTTNGQDGTYHYKTFGTKTLEGAFAVQVQYEKGTEWHDSLMRLGEKSRSETDLTVQIESDDNVGSGDLDFDDLVLSAKRTVDSDEWCVWGQVKKYSGCWFNPCLMPKLVIDDWVHAAPHLPSDLVLQMEPLLPEIPPLDLPYPPPPPPWDYHGIRVEVPSALAQAAMLAPRAAKGRGAFRISGFKALSNPGIETYAASDAALVQSTELSSALAGKLQLKCRIDTAPGVMLRVIDYDPGPGESAGQLFAGTGNKEVLGHVLTDDWGYYLFCFHWPYPSATGGLRPDIILQLIQPNEEGVPAVKLESEISWNIDHLHRKDFCVPDHLLAESPPDEVVTPGRVFQYVGNLPVVRITQLGAARGHATSMSGDLVSVDRAPFGGVLYLKGSFHDYPQVKSYRIRYWTTDTPEGNIGMTTLDTPLTYYNADYNSVKVGPGPDVFSGVPADAYPVMDGNYAYSHPFGRQYLAYINTSRLLSGAMTTGFLHVSIEGLDAGGAPVAGATDAFAMRIDNVPPVPEIEPITAGSGVGAGCGYITLANWNDTFPLTYRVRDKEGHLWKYYFRLFKCHNNQIGGSQYSPVYDATFPLHWEGTQDDPSGTVSTTPTWDGWVTADMPASGTFVTAQDVADGVNFVAVSIELWAVSRTTDGRHSHLQWPRYVEVVGVKLADS
jgi:hypothetical protein